MDECFRKTRTRQEMQVNVASRGGANPIAFGRAWIDALDTFRHRIDHRISKFVPTRRSRACFNFDVAEFGQPSSLHSRRGWEDSYHGPSAGVGIDDRLCEVHEAATFAVDGRAARDEPRN